MLNFGSVHLESGTANSGHVASPAQPEVTAHRRHANRWRAVAQRVDVNDTDAIAIRCIANGSQENTPDTLHKVPCRTNFDIGRRSTRRAGAS